MEEFKGTPGPWSLDEYCNVVHGEKDGYGRKQNVRVSGVTLPGRVTEEYAANTQLVSAAPELLEALQDMVSRIEYYANLDISDKPSIEDWAYTYNSSDMDAARAAIAKALGKE